MTKAINKIVQPSSSNTLSYVTNHFQEFKIYSASKNSTKIELIKKELLIKMTREKRDITNLSA